MSNVTKHYRVDSRDDANNIRHDIRVTSWHRSLRQPQVGIEADISPAHRVRIAVGKNAY